MKIQIGKFQKDIEPNISIATCLEFVLIWGSASDDSASLLRVHASAIGVALEDYALLPSYKPERDKILVYGYKCLDRLLSQNVSTDEIYSSGAKILSMMLDRILKQKEVKEKEDFFCSPEEEIKDI